MSDLSLDHPELPIRLPLQRRRVWRACECCRRKKIKCDGREPVCSQCTQTSSTCNWIQTKDRAALSRQYALSPFRFPSRLNFPASYVQELEARLIQMEGLLTQVGSTPSRTADPSSSTSQNQQQSTPPPSSSDALDHPTASNATSENNAYVVDPNVKQEPAEPDHFGQLAMDHNGHLRWIGGSSAMTLVDAFRNISNRAIQPSKTDTSQNRISRPESRTNAHNLYFPPVLRSGVRALPGPEEAEFPPRDLADKLVSPNRCLPLTIKLMQRLGRRLFHSFPSYIARSGFNRFSLTISAFNGRAANLFYFRDRFRHCSFCRICMCCTFCRRSSTSMHRTRSRRGRHGGRVL